MSRDWTSERFTSTWITSLYTRTVLFNTSISVKEDRLLYWSDVYLTKSPKSKNCIRIIFLINNYLRIIYYYVDIMNLFKSFNVLKLILWELKKWFGTIEKGNMKVVFSSSPIFSYLRSYWDSMFSARKVFIIKKSAEDALQHLYHASNFRKMRPRYVN